MLKWLRSMPDRYGRPAVKGAYLAPLDGLRALAIAIVIVWHVAIRVFRLTLHGRFDPSDNAGFLHLVPHGEVGVSLFFFISGFIIVRPFLARPGRLSGEAVRTFYLRRIARIAPPHILLVTLSFLALGVFGYRPEHAVNFDIAHQSLASSYAASVVYLNGLLYHTPPRLNPPTWSLEIEMQFYLLFPALLALLSLHRSRVDGGHGTAIAAIVAAVFTIAVTARWGAYTAVRWTVFSYLYLFLLGIAVAQWERNKRQHRVSMGAYDSMCLFGVVLLLATGLFRAHQDAAAVTLRIAATMAAVLLVFYGAMRGRVATALFSQRWIALFGAMSYSIYLTHVAVIQSAATLLFRRVSLPGTAANMALALALIVPIILVVGSTYYIVVERIFMRLGQHARQPPVPA